MTYLSKKTPQPFLTLCVILLALFLAIALKTAWLGDDVFITLRQVWNAINGYGFTYNFDQRVQAFTHPTWALLLTVTTFFTKELYFTTIALSVVLSMSSIIFLLRYLSQQVYAFPERVVGLFCVASLAFSKAFTDYMTSGLENALSFFLSGLVFLLLQNIEHGDRLKLSCIYVALACLFLNRFDYALLFFPLVIYISLLKFSLKESMPAAAPGLIILASWFAFSFIYFGSPLPNTYFAKLHAGYPPDQVYARGLAYYDILLSKDLITLVIISLGFLTGFIGRRPINISLSLGIFLYCGYIIKAGGDFMQGRFFALLCYLSIFNIYSILLLAKFRLATYIVIFLLAGPILFSIRSAPIFSPLDHHIPLDGKPIVDERGYYFEKYGLFSPRRNWPRIVEPAQSKPKLFSIECGGLGAKGLDRPHLYLIDKCGLTDAFLSRLPAIQDPEWRIGHHLRKVPTDYPHYLVEGESLVDSYVARLLDDVTEVISGEIFSKQRFAAISRVIAFNYHFDRELYTDPDKKIDYSSRSKKVDYRDVNHVEKAGHGELWDAKGNILFEYMLKIDNVELKKKTGFTISLEQNNIYNIVVNDRHEFTANWVGKAKRSRRYYVLKSHQFYFDEAIDIDTVTIRVVRGEGYNAIGHLIFDGK